MTEVNVEVAAITPSQALKLRVLKLVTNDTAAAREAIAFVGDSELKYEMFAHQFAAVYTEQGVVAKTSKAIQNAVEALSLFE
ncbi:DUF2560 family protein [Yersinia intermedia]|uniref:DUF2560 family protein n=1 Tax=Yersinia intermedia TaxID=631 RepID=UPI000B7058E1|nr:DUF2560 family protein [Yersinia intermedia]EKN3779763.1 DUF2560 family protein [Yersinia enterocolitica]ELI8374824.1 DUF2560 family protein [Yersinia enterocolitica]MCW8110148.1 DUF2560 family protein [Yersinia intermedia]MDA5480864.1 DUF2560 family protein [Yersinia intermedia]MDA5515133.1 DUF2560 family protein [Yersinia intermedia]